MKFAALFSAFLILTACTVTSPLSPPAVTLTPKEVVVLCNGISGELTLVSVRPNQGPKTKDFIAKAQSWASRACGGPVPTSPVVLKADLTDIANGFKAAIAFVSADTELTPAEKTNDLQILLGLQTTAELYLTAN